jgi:uncharacterized protein Smg (DUF494 family)
MKIAITDANVFIDLLEADLIAFLFEIGYEIHTTLEVLNELFDEQQSTLHPFVNNGRLTLKVFLRQNLYDYRSKISPEDYHR